MAKTLLELRVQIDAVDQELLQLLNRRAALAHEVGEIKKGEGSVVFRPEREAQVIGALQRQTAETLKTAAWPLSGEKLCPPAALWKRPSALPI